MPDPSRETSDPAEVREWADRRGLVPARRADANELVLVDEAEAESDGATDRLGWDEFAAEFDRRDATFRLRGEDADAADGEAAGGDEAATADPGAVGRAGPADALEEGESARTEVTETRKVETEVERSATVETEVVDEEVTSEEVIDTQLLDRELLDCSMDESGERIEAELRERKRYTTEVRKRDLIESRVVDADADAAGTGTVDDAETVDREVDTEGESALVDEETVERELDGSEVRERARTEAAADAVEDETRLDERIERRIVETEVVSRYRVRADVTARDSIGDEVVSEEITETELLDRDGSEAERGGSEGAADDAVWVDGDGDGDAPAESDDGDAEGTGDADPFDETVWVDDSHEGDAVVDADGERVGRIDRVDGLTIHVDADPETEAFGDGDETSIRQDQVEEVRDGTVRVSGLGRE